MINWIKDGLLLCGVVFITPLIDLFKFEDDMSYFILDMIKLTTVILIMITAIIRLIKELKSNKK